MCGIVGFINLDKKPAEEEILWSMTNALTHRGPDGAGIYVDHLLGFGHRRLAIIDLSKRADQPMQVENGDYVIIYNGEVYNFIELRKKLQDENIWFFSESDTEVILKSFAKCGPAALNLYNGMFAFAFWDKRHRTLTLARDRYGIKPLYYWQNNNVFLFASEIKAFLKHPQFKAQLDEESLVEYFTFQNTFTDKTLFKGVKLLPAGCFMQISFDKETKQEIKQYWDFLFEPETSIKSEQEYFEECGRLFRQAVKRQLVSDVEIGSYLSGGIDTASIVAIASQDFKELKTFCIGFDLSSISGLERAFDEREKAEHISYLYQTEHYEMVLKSGDMKRCLPQLVWAVEDLRLGQSYPNFYASKLASRLVKVCLSGGGGDELFAGYPWRYFNALKNGSFNDYVRDYYNYWQRLIPNAIAADFFSPIWNNVKNVNCEDIFTNILRKHKLVSQSPADYINHSLYFEAKTFLHGLFILEDKLSMAHGLETRVPFLDNDLVDFAQKIPLVLKLGPLKNFIKINEDDNIERKQYFIKSNEGKLILRKVLSNYVGGNIASSAKQGFSGPDASWFKGESIDYVQELLLNEKACLYDYLDRRSVKNVIDEHIQGKLNHRLLIWSLLNFEWWLKLFIKGEAGGIIK